MREKESGREGSEGSEGRRKQGRREGWMTTTKKLIKVKRDQKRNYEEWVDELGGWMKEVER